MYKKRLKNLKKFKFFCIFYHQRQKTLKMACVLVKFTPKWWEKNEPAMSQLEMGFAKASKSPKKDYFKVSI